MSGQLPLLLSDGSPVLHGEVIQQSMKWTPRWNILSSCKSACERNRRRLTASGGSYQRGPPKPNIELVCVLHEPMGPSMTGPSVGRPRARVTSTHEIMRVWKNEMVRYCEAHECILCVDRQRL